MRHPVPSATQILRCISSADGRRDVYDGAADSCIGCAYAELADLLMPAQLQAASLVLGMAFCCLVANSCSFLSLLLAPSKVI